MADSNHPEPANKEEHHKHPDNNCSTDTSPPASKHPDQWTSGPVLINVAPALTTDHPPKSINLIDTIGHSKRVPYNNDDSNAHWLPSRYNQCNDKFIQEEIYPIFVTACRIAGFTVHGQWNKHCKCIRFKCLRGKFYQNRVSAEDFSEGSELDASSSSNKKTRIRITQRPFKECGDVACPFTFRVYWDADKSRWFLPHFQCGTPYHCQHSQQSPDSFDKSSDDELNMILGGAATCKNKSKTKPKSMAHGPTVHAIKKAKFEKKQERLRQAALLQQQKSQVNDLSKQSHQYQTEYSQSDEQFIQWSSWFNDNGGKRKDYADFITVEDVRAIRQMKEAEKPSRKRRRRNENNGGSNKNDLLIDSPTPGTDLDDEKKKKERLHRIATWIEPFFDLKEVPNTTPTSISFGQTASSDSLSYSHQQPYPCQIERKKLFVAEGTEAVRLMIQRCSATDTSGTEPPHQKPQSTLSFSEKPPPVHLYSILSKPSSFFEPPVHLLSDLEKRNFLNPTDTSYGSDFQSPPFKIVIGTEEALTEIAGFPIARGAMACGVVPSHTNAYVWLRNLLEGPGNHNIKIEPEEILSSNVTAVGMRGESTKAKRTSSPATALRSIKNEQIGKPDLVSSASASATKGEPDRSTESKTATLPQNPLESSIKLGRTDGPGAMETGHATEQNKGPTTAQKNLNQSLTKFNQIVRPEEISSSRVALAGCEKEGTKDEGTTPHPEVVLSSCIASTGLGRKGTITATTPGNLHKSPIKAEQIEKPERILPFNIKDMGDDEHSGGNGNLTKFVVPEKSSSSAINRAGFGKGNPGTRNSIRGRHLNEPLIKAEQKDHLIVVPSYDVNDRGHREGFSTKLNDVKELCPSLPQSAQRKTHPHLSSPPLPTHINIKKNRPLRRILALDEISNAANLGSIIRTAAAFSIDAIILSDDSCDAWYRQSVRVSMGHVVTVPTIRVRDWRDGMESNGGSNNQKASGLADLVRWLRKEMCVECFAAVVDDEFKPNNPSIFNGDHCPPPLSTLESLAREARVSTSWCCVLGNEGHGIRDDVIMECDYRVKIGMAEGVDSLSLPVAAGILMHGLVDRQLRCK